MELWRRRRHVQGGEEVLAKKFLFYLTFFYFMLFYFFYGPRGGQKCPGAQFMQFQQFLAADGPPARQFILFFYLPSLHRLEQKQKKNKNRPQPTRSVKQPVEGLIIFAGSIGPKKKWHTMSTLVQRTQQEGFSKAGMDSRK